MALPEVTEGTRWNRPTWFAGPKAGFAWERPLSKNDIKQLKALGREVPEGDLLGLRIEAVEMREAVIAADPEVLFTIPHFEGYPAVLLRLDDADPEKLEELLEEAWLVCAPKALADAYLAEHADD